MGLFDAIGQGVQNAWNLYTGGTAQQNLQFQKDYAQAQWNREDNAVQRRAADLQAAGINPLLAAGSPAAATPVQTPQLNMDQNQTPVAGFGAITGAGRGVADLLQGVVNVQKTIADTFLVKAQTSNVQQQVSFDALANPERLKQLSNQAAISGLDFTKAYTTLSNVIDSYDLSNQEAQARVKLLGIQSDVAGQTFKNMNQDFAAKVIAIAMSKDQQKILHDMASANPGLADAITKWLGVAQGAVSMGAKFAP